MRPTLPKLAAIALMTTFLLVEAVALPASPPVVRVPTPEIPSALAPLVAPNIAGWTSVILARPLFRSNRRPLASSATTAAMPRLSAIVVTAAGALAIFSPTDDSAPITAGAGSAVDGYTVVNISRESVTMRAPDGAEQKLAPQFTKPGTATGVATSPFTPPLSQDHF